MPKRGALNKGAANFVFSESVNATPEISEKVSKKRQKGYYLNQVDLALIKRPA